MGPSIYMPISCNHSIFEGTDEANISCVYYCLRCDVDWQLDRYNKCATSWGKHVNLSVSLCSGILCLSAHSFISHNSDFESHLARISMARSNLAGNWIHLGNQSFFNLCGAVCEERKEIARSVPCVLLLFDSRVVNSTILILTVKLI